PSRFATSLDRRCGTENAYPARPQCASQIGRCGTAIQSCAAYLRPRWEQANYQSARETQNRSAHPQATAEYAPYPGWLAACRLLTLPRKSPRYSAHRLDQSLTHRTDSAEPSQLLVPNSCNCAQFTSFSNGGLKLAQIFYMAYNRCKATEQ